MPEPSHYTRIPNLIEDDRRIDASAFRVYAHYRRRAGEDGEYWGGVREAAVACQLSQPTVVKAKATLIETGYILCRKVLRGRDKRWVDVITIADVWTANREKYQAEPETPPDESACAQPGERDRSNIEAHALSDLSARAFPDDPRSNIEAHALNNESARAKSSGTTKKNPGKNPAKNLLLAAEGSEPLPDDLPEAVAAFVLKLRENPTFDGGIAFARKVAKDYGSLDLEEMAINMLDWLRKHPDRQCSTRFVFNWLKGDKADGASGQQQRARAAPGAGSSPPARAAQQPAGALQFVFKNRSPSTTQGGPAP